MIFFVLNVVEMTSVEDADSARDSTGCVVFTAKEYSAWIHIGWELWSGYFESLSVLRVATSCAKHTNLLRGVRRRTFKSAIVCHLPHSFLSYCRKTESAGNSSIHLALEYTALEISVRHFRCNANLILVCRDG